MEKSLLILSVIGSWFAFLLGEWHISLTVLALFMAIDIVTGVMRAMVTRSVNSKMGYKGFIRKAGIMLVIIIANLLDLLTNGEFLFRNLTVLFYVSLESVSIIENLGHIGVPLPEQISKYLKQLSDKGRIKK